MLSDWASFIDKTTLSENVTMLVVQDFDDKNPCCRISSKCDVLRSNSLIRIRSKIFITKVVREIGR